MSSLNRTAYFYWGSNPLSYLRFITIPSFMKHNPEWKVKIFRPLVEYTKDPSWVSHSHKSRYVGRDYFLELYNLDVDIETIDFRNIGFRENVHEAYKSDYLRWWLLSNYGGFWSDFDVVFSRPLKESDFENVDFCITGRYDPTIYYIAYIYAKPKSEIANILLKCAQTSHYFDPSNYQCLGNVLLLRCFPKPTSFKDCAPHVDVNIIDPVINLPVVNVTYIKHIFEQANAVDMSNSVGLHWYGGHPMATDWENKLTYDTVKDYNTSLCDLIKEQELCAL